MTDFVSGQHPRGRAGRFVATGHGESDISLELASIPVVDYHGSHRAPSDDGYSRCISDLDDDMFEHPQWYTGEVDPETMAQLRAARGNPAAELTIYRALPPEFGEFHDGDWVTLSRRYAVQHAVQSDDLSQDWPVISMRVSASQVFSDGNDLSEFGYAGPSVVADRIAG